MATEDNLNRAEELLAKLEAARGELDRLATEEGGGSPERALGHVPLVEEGQRGLPGVAAADRHASAASCTSSRNEVE